MTARELIDYCFQTLIRLIEEKRIAPGSIDERIFLKQAIDKCLQNLLGSHGIFSEPSVLVNWNPRIPDALHIEIDPPTLHLLKTKGLY